MSSALARMASMRGSEEPRLEDHSSVSTDTSTTQVWSDSAGDAQQTKHNLVISLVWNKTVKICKEIGRGRKFRDLHGKLDDAIEALVEFQNVEWPPHKKEPLSPPEWMSERPEPHQSVSTGENSISNVGKQTHQTGSVNDMDDLANNMNNRMTVGQTVDSNEGLGNLNDLNSTENQTLEKEHQHLKEDGVPADVAHHEDDNDNAAKIIAIDTRSDSMSCPAQRAALSHFDEDSDKCEPMHPAVVTSVLAYCHVMSSPSKTSKMTELALECITLLVASRYVSGKAGGRKIEKSKDTASNKSGGEADNEPSLLHHLIDSITRCAESPMDVVQVNMARSLLSIMTSPKCDLHEAPMLMAVRATFHVYLISKSSAARDFCKSTLLDMLRTVFSRMEAYDAMSQKDETRSGNGDNVNLVDDKKPGLILNGNVLPKISNTLASQTPDSFSAFASQYHTDGYLLFRALCKLSAKTLPGDDGINVQSGAVASKFFYGSPLLDPLALSSKILSLELILAVFEHCGDAFRTGEKFIYAVQNYLCVSLLKNCTSHDTTVAHLSLRIFLLLVYKFKAHLKAEIEVFVANIFLRVLESPNSPYEQKSLVLEALRALCSDPQILTQIFLNYDCDFDAVNLYRSIVHNLTRLSGRTRAPQYAGHKTAAQDSALSIAGLEVLIVILRAFLKALKLPGGDDNFDGDDASGLSKIRGSLQLDIGLAAQIENRASSVKASTNVDNDEISVSADDIKDRNESGTQGDTSGAAEKIVDVFDRKRTAQQNFETGVVKFTLSAKSGLLFYMEHGFLNLDAREVAIFLHEHKERLDKTQIGEVLGREPDASFVKDVGAEPEQGGSGFYLRVLYHYVDAMNFTGIEFDTAIRAFLAGFRLPGEAQKIDRIMEKFAERYTRQNESVFPSADTAFILAFSVIMLNTDLHNPSIKPERRMTVESFIRNNRGISVEGGDLPDSFLEGIFKRIQAQPFTLKEDDAFRAKQGSVAKELFDNTFLFEGPAFLGLNAEERKREKFRKEREEMMAASELLFRKRPGRSGAEKATMTASNQLAESVSPSDVVKPMFDVTWGPLIGTLSQVLEMANDSGSTAHCLNGFVYAVRIASHSDMSLARDTFVNSLAKFTTLGSMKEMKSKNIECIRTLLSIAIMDGEFLGESWGPVLQCISQLGRLQLFASGLAADDAFLNVSAKDNPDNDGGGFFRQSTKAENSREMEESNGRAVLEAINEVLIDKVFSSSVNLSARGIVHFIECLIAVSDAEITGSSRPKRGISDVSRKSLTESSQSTSPIGSRSSSSHGDDGPRIFSLQRLVEVADYNMDVRPRLAWTQMWEMMAKHFAKIGCHDNGMVSMFAIDALRQLSFKFLEKPELTDFNFQRLFLRPFFLIMENPGSREDIRELILRCVDNMIRSMSHNLRSGWKIFFSILTLSASDPSERINTLGLAILQRLLDQNLDQLCRPPSYDALSDERTTSFDGNEPFQMNAAERRQRNSNAEDFVSLCRASLSFVQIEVCEHPLPIGLSMRALCHMACYADLIADGKVLPPVSGTQSNDTEAIGYSYEGLPIGEAEEMVLWRPLLDGLAAGICSSATSNTGGVGCLIQRGSVIAMRAILLRHGTRFSILQWSAILNQVILPAIQIGAECDYSPVASIISETPSVSSLDFLAEPLPRPPNSNDEGLVKFATKAQSDDSAPLRPLGEAELLVEVSFADLRHGGDGNLSRAYGLKKKDLEGKSNAEQPFPDSWIATTAPIALGMMTDVLVEIILNYGAEGRKSLWPIIFSQIQRWSIGYPLLKPICLRDSGDDEDVDVWMPCEAIVRIGCAELFRAVKVVTYTLPGMDDEELRVWSETLCQNLADSLSKNVLAQSFLHENLVETKLKTLGIEGSNSEEHQKANRATTAYGTGKVVTTRSDHYDGLTRPVEINVVELDFGAILYGPCSEHIARLSPQRPKESKKKSGQSSYLDIYIPPLKARCVAAHCLQHNLNDVVCPLVALSREAIVSSLLTSLEQSRQIAHKAGLDEDLSHAFQEVMFNEWGDGVEEVEAVFASIGGTNHRGKSAMFFLSQEAGANNSIVLLLSFLYSFRSQNLDGGQITPNWDFEGLSEPLLLERIVDVLGKFLSSEKKDGYFIDPNVWRNASESGEKIAIYCTSFAGVVVNILKAILRFSIPQFERHKAVLYPLLCSLIRAQSEEIRQFLQEIFVQRVAPLCGLRN